MNEEAHVVGPVTIGADGYSKVLTLVQGDQVLGQLYFYSVTGTVVWVDASSRQVHDRLVAEAKARGLLYGKDIPDHLQHDLEHE